MGGDKRCPSTGCLFERSSHPKYIYINLHSFPSFRFRPFMLSLSSVWRLSVACVRPWRPCSIGWASIRRDGFASLQHDHDVGNAASAVGPAPAPGTVSPGRPHAGPSHAVTALPCWQSHVANDDTDDAPSGGCATGFSLLSFLSLSLLLSLPPPSLSLLSLPGLTFARCATGPTGCTLPHGGNVCRSPQRRTKHVLMSTKRVDSAPKSPSPTCHGVPRTQNN